MRGAAILLTVTALLAVPATALAAERFTADLTTRAEIPRPEDAEGASGQGEVTISDDATSLDYEVSYEGMTGDVMAAHIHFGGPDVAGPVMIPLEVAPSPFSGTFAEADFAPVEDGPQTWEEALAAIRGGESYINLHTGRNPSGEIRGQLREMPPTDGLAQAPAGSSSGVPIIVLFAAAMVGMVLMLRRVAVQR